MSHNSPSMRETEVASAMEGLELSNTSITSNADVMVVDSSSATLFYQSPYSPRMIHGAADNRAPRSRLLDNEVAGALMDLNQTESMAEAMSQDIDMVDVTPNEATAAPVPLSQAFSNAFVAEQPNSPLLIPANPSNGSIALIASPAPTSTIASSPPPLPTIFNPAPRALGSILAAALTSAQPPTPSQCPRTPEMRPANPFPSPPPAPRRNRIPCVLSPALRPQVPVTPQMTPNRFSSPPPAPRKRRYDDYLDKSL